MAQVDQVGQVRPLVQLDGRGDLDHLQERDRALLPAGAAGTRRGQQRQPFCRRPSYGGIEAVVADLADALVARGHDVTLLGAGEPGTSARFVPLWDRTVPARLGEPYPEVMHALRVRREIARIAETEGVDIVHDHTFAGPLNAPAYKALGLPTVVTVHGPIDDDLYQYYRELGDEVGLIAISDRQRELASELNWVGRVL
jgi:glycosyltransferase involved in cell wall biosynthesis